ncbi:hypothetical protein KKE92_04815 [Candidatus Micrarchaeota archaeon]|nr:hypothetical protein [Candidatus Micrarchaeota archaeon]
MAIWGISIFLFPILISLIEYGSHPDTIEYSTLVLPIYSINLSVSLIAIYLLCKNRYKNGQSGDMRLDFLFGFLPMMMIWTIIFISAVMLPDGCGCAGMACFCVFLIPLFFLVPVIIYSAYMGGAVIYFSHIYKNKDIKSGLEIWLFLSIIYFIFPIIVELMLVINSTAMPDYGSNSLFSDFQSTELYLFEVFLSMIIPVLSFYLIYRDVNKTIESNPKLVEK